MSIIQIIQHNESIYKISESHELPEVAKQRVKDPKNKYVPFAQLREEIKKSSKKNTKPFGAMGRPVQYNVNPQEYLRKGTGKPYAVVKSGDAEAVKKPARALPPVPVTKEVLQETKDKIQRVRKNHLAQNARIAVTMPPKTPARRVAITIDGETRDLSAGLEPRFLTADYFGKVPPYLDKLIKLKQRVKERKKDLAGIHNPPCIYITCEERKELLNGLKMNWEELQRTYQGLPILTDTLPKMIRKAKLEDGLKQLEKDILLIEKHPYIYVYNDEDDI